LTELERPSQYASVQTPLLLHSACLLVVQQVVELLLAPVEHWLEQLVVLGEVQVQKDHRPRWQSFSEFLLPVLRRDCAMLMELGALVVHHRQEPGAQSEGLLLQAVVVGGPALFWVQVEAAALLHWRVAVVRGAQRVQVAAELEAPLRPLLGSHSWGEQEASSQNRRHRPLEVPIQERHRNTPHESRHPTAVMESHRFAPAHTQSLVRRQPYTYL
jgi:hypothetical protein